MPRQLAVADVADCSLLATVELESFMSYCCCNSSAGKEVDDDDFISVGFPPAAVLILAANFEGGDLRDADSPRCALLVTPFGEIFRLLATGELESFVSSCCCNSTGLLVSHRCF